MLKMVAIWPYQLMLWIITLELLFPTSLSLADMGLELCFGNYYCWTLSFWMKFPLHCALFIFSSFFQSPTPSSTQTILVLSSLDERLPDEIIMITLLSNPLQIFHSSSTFDLFVAIHTWPFSSWSACFRFFPVLENYPSFFFPIPFHFLFLLKVFSTREKNYSLPRWFCSLFMCSSHHVLDKPPQARLQPRHMLFHFNESKIIKIILCPYYLFLVIQVEGLSYILCYPF